jgi:predicted DCC family thiol-disulfide oxidoreductase YuxK
MSMRANLPFLGWWAMPRAVLLYDRDCGFCRWSAAWALRLDRRRQLEPAAIQGPRGQELLAGVDPERQLDSAHLVTADGELSSAGAIGAPVLGMFPAGKPLARLADRIPGTAERVYRFVSAHRAAFGRVLTKGARQRADALIAARSREA